MNGKREYDLRDQERREQAANVRVGALCRVEKFDPAAMRVDVQPLSKALDAGVYRTQPQILSVPVALVRGGGFVLRPCCNTVNVVVDVEQHPDIPRFVAGAQDKVEIKGDVEVQGKVKVRDDVIAKTVSLVSQKHTDSRNGNTSAPLP